MLEQVARKLRHRKLTRSFGEIDRAIGADVEIVETAKPLAIRFFGQQRNLARRVYCAYWPVKAGAAGGVHAAGAIGTGASSRYASATTMRRRTASPKRFLR